MVTIGVTRLTDVTPVNAIGVPECGSAVSWGDWLSPAVWCREKTLIRKNSEVRRDDFIRCDPADTNCTVPAGGSAGSLESLLCDPRCPVTEDMNYWERLEVLGNDSYDY